jgi:hypothetical protein
MKDKKMKKDASMEAKMEALKELREMASKAMSDDMDELQKVSVMAPDKEGLEEGLEKAREMLGKKLKDDEDEDEE